MTTRTARQRLIDLAVWAAGENAKMHLGLPSEWAQESYLGSTGCGTTCCIAGKVAIEDGALPAITDDYGNYITDRTELFRLWLDPDNEGAEASRVLLPGQQEPVYVMDYATTALDLTPFEADRLFSGNNDLGNVLRVIRKILDRMRDDVQEITY